LIAAGDVVGLADAMQEALTSAPPDLLALGRNGHGRTRQLHDATVEAAKLRELFAATRPGGSAGGAAMAVESKVDG